MKFIISISATLLILVNSWAQDYTAWQSVFEESYEYEGDKQYSEALNILKEQYKADSYDFNIRYGWLYYLMGNYPESKKYYKKAMELLPYSHEAKFGYVLPLSGLGEWDEIIRVYQEMLKLDPKNTVVNYRLGAIYYERKDYQKSYNYLEEVINLYPNDYDSNLLFAWTNLQMGKLKEAKILFNKVLLINPDDESAQQGLKLIQ